MLLKTLLSRTCFFGTMPALFSCWRSASYAHIISVSLQLLMGSTRMALLLVSTVALLGLHRELARLVENQGFAYLVRFGVDIAHFLAIESRGVACF